MTPELDRLTRLALAHLKAKRSLTPLGLCRCLGLRPYRAINTLSSLPIEGTRVLEALGDAIEIQAIGGGRGSTRIVLREPEASPKV